LPLQPVHLQELQLLTRRAAPVNGAALFQSPRRALPSRALGRLQSKETGMAKGQAKSNKEARKPKKEKVKTIAANPSTKGGGGLTKD
jgi:hypothetical protein